MENEVTISKPDNLPAYYPSNPVDITDSNAPCNPEEFIKELQELCQKHNMTIFAGALGLRFIPRDSEGVNIEGTNDISSVYFTQSFASKEFIPVE